MNSSLRGTSVSPATTGPKYALNYSEAAADLARRGEITVDLWKCPAWPEQIAAAQTLGDVYVHFPLRVGTGTGVTINTETDAPVDWDAFEQMRESTGSPCLNVHLGPQPRDFPTMSIESTAPADIRTLTDALVRDVSIVVERFGPDLVVSENVFGDEGIHVRAAIVPDVICEVVETTGCGLLLDLSHAHLAAEELGMAPEAYVEALPVNHLRELHVTGIQAFDDRWAAYAGTAGMNAELLENLSGRRIDHLPMTAKDWRFLAWALERIQCGAWGTPKLVAFEYGGLGNFFKPTTIEEALRLQVPRMYTMVHDGGDPWADEGGSIERFWL